MISVQRFSDLGEMKNEWLHARYHFSFARYYNPDRMSFGHLRVLNDDQVQAGKGFSPHPHENMEIITYVRQGQILHRDSLGNSGVTKAGDVQVMSAGAGILHSEFAGGHQDTVLFQIWIEPNVKGVKPRWDQAVFPPLPAKDTLPLLVSGRDRDKDKGALFIYQDAAVYGGKLEKSEITQAVSDQAYVVVSKGSVTVNGMLLNAGDGAEVSGESMLTLSALDESELLVIDVGELQ